LIAAPLAPSAPIVPVAAPAPAPVPAPAPERAPEPQEEDNDIVVRIPIRRGSRFQRRFGAAVIAAAVLMLASVAVAAGGKRVWAVLFTPAQEVETPAPQEPAPLPKKSSKKGVKSKNVAAPAKPEATDEETTSDETTDEQIVLPSNVVAPVHTANDAPVAPVACVPAPAPVAPPTLAPARISSTQAVSPPPAVVPAPIAPIAPVVPAPAVAPAPQAQDTTAAALFSDANSARRRGDHKAAIALYTDLTDKHDAAPEAAAARIALGRMLLDDGDAASALPLFDRYLRDGDGSLREEAMVGRARAFEKLGRNYDELAAWNRLLASYPQSVHKAHAEARLEELKSR
jgi:hypothetical protein